MVDGIQGSCIFFFLLVQKAVRKWGGVMPGQVASLVWGPGLCGHL